MAIEIPHGHYGKISPRSNLAIKHIDIGGIIFNSDYRGVMKVLLINNSEQPFSVNIGDKIAQIIFSKIGIANLVTGELSKMKEELEASAARTPCQLLHLPHLHRQQIHLQPQTNMPSLTTQLHNREKLSSNFQIMTIASKVQ